MAVADRETRVSPLTFAGDGLLLLCALGGFTCSFLTLYGDRDLGRYASYQATPLDWCAARWDTFLLLAALLQPVLRTDLSRLELDWTPTARPFRSGRRNWSWQKKRSWRRS